MNRQVEIGDLAPVEIEADHELMRRAVEHVVRNGLRHTPAGSSVTVKLLEKAALVLDFGRGVPAEALSILFDPFFQVDSARNQFNGGAGLRLTIARRAIAAHGGSIEAKHASPGLQAQLKPPQSS